MKNSFRNVLMAVAGATLGIATFLVVQAATTDSVTVSVTIPGTLTIADDNVNFSIAALTPGTADTSQENTLTVSSNSVSGFTVSVDLDDLDATAGQLCVDNGSGGCTTNLFDGDGTTSYISFTSDAGTGSLGSLTNAAFTGSETKLGTSSYTAFTADDPTNSDSFHVSYDAFADASIPPGTYKGSITFTIVSN